VMSRLPPGNSLTAIPEIVTTLRLLSSDEINPVQVVGVLFAAVEEGRGVLRFGECWLWRLSLQSSKEVTYCRSCSGQEVCKLSHQGSSCKVLCLGQPVRESRESLSYRQELLQDFEFNARD
jgi:hypothetical protein